MTTYPFTLKRGHFMNHLPTSFCPCSYWTTPYRGFCWSYHLLSFFRQKAWSTNYFDPNKPNWSRYIIWTNLCFLQKLNFLTVYVIEYYNHFHKLTQIYRFRSDCRKVHIFAHKKWDIDPSPLLIARPRNTIRSKHFWIRISKTINDFNTFYCWIA